MSAQRLGFAALVLAAGLSGYRGAHVSKAAAVGCDPVATTACERRPIDIVICLDTSDSMQGLIDSARARLWDIVASLSSVRPLPDLRVGLITYGSPSRASGSQGWVVLQKHLTSDLDGVYAKMMEFSTDGGNEYVGWALHDAIRRMEWSSDPKALKIIFVAGNESADQGREYHDFRSEAAAARARGILVNAIYAGDHNAGVQERWAEVASLGRGSYSAIDMSCGTVQIETSHDKLLLELNMKLNATYVPYGDAGQEGLRQQVAQDANADRLGRQSAATRAVAKATGLYQNQSWDLVDAVARGEKKVDEVREEDLPPAMKAMPKDERVEYVRRKQTERANLQKEINEISAARDQEIRQRRASASGGKAALDEAMLESIRKQAESQGFEFEK